MAGPHSLTDLDRELADAFRAQPSGEFRARIRARVAGEAMNDRWRLSLPAAYAGMAGVIMTGAIWFMSFSEAPRRRYVMRCLPAARRCLRATRHQLGRYHLQPTPNAYPEVQLAMCPAG